MLAPWLDDGDVRLYLGDNLEVLRRLPDRSVHNALAHHNSQGWY